jgi:hypothetical protein
MKNLRRAILLFLFFLASASVLSAEGGPLSLWLDFETGAAFTGCNDVRIPADEGTGFSLADDLAPQEVWFYRLQAGADYGPHSLFLLYAPLYVESTGSCGSDILFNGKTFSAGSDLTAGYKFNSYRLSYTYTFLESPKFSLAAGLTGKVRDAYIGLENDTLSTKRTDLGFVPLLHLSAEWRFAPSFSLLLDGDGLAAPQGRAEDFLLALVWAFDDSTMLRLGYRILEGGSDGGGSVYTFSMFHYAGIGLRRYF